MTWADCATAGMGKRFNSDALVDADDAIFEVHDYRRGSDYVYSGALVAGTAVSITVRADLHVKALISNIDPKRVGPRFFTRARSIARSLTK